MLQGVLGPVWGPDFDAVGAPGEGTSAPLNPKNLAGE